MNKPISMMFEEFKQNLASLINSSGLSPFVIESILQNYLNEVSNIAKNQYNLDKSKYMESLMEPLKDVKESDNKDNKYKK